MTVFIVGLLMHAGVIDAVVVAGIHYLMVGIVILIRVVHAVVVSVGWHSMLNIHGIHVDKGWGCRRANVACNICIHIRTHSCSSNSSISSRRNYQGLMIAIVGQELFVIWQCFMLQ